MSSSDAAEPLIDRSFDSSDAAEPRSHRSLGRSNVNVAREVPPMCEAAPAGGEARLATWCRQLALRTLARRLLAGLHPGLVSKLWVHVGREA